jgi:hypothetical protein
MLKRYISVLLTTLLTSCIDIIDMDIPYDGPDLMIEAKINDQGKCEVKLTSTVDVNDLNEFAAITEGTVVLTDKTNGQREQLTQNFPGVYTGTLPGISGHTYMLEVTVRGNTYTATSTMPHKVPFDALDYEEALSLNGDTYRMLASFRDPDTLGNAYRYVMYQNGIASKNIFVRNDAFTNGNTVQQPVFNPNIKIVKGDVIEVEFQCIDENVFEYFNGIMLLQTDRGITPTNPGNNIEGGALGYFSAHTSERKSLTIQ